MGSYHPGSYRCSWYLVARAYKSIIMQKIIDADGGNFCDRRKQPRGE